MRDFTLQIYRQLLEKLKNREYWFITFCDYMAMQNLTNGTEHQTQNVGNSINHSPNQSTCILRHDVDRIPANALTIAKIEHEMGISGSYYFRIVPESFDEKIIREIAELGHEIGYHYEEIDTAYRKLKMKNGGTVQSQPPINHQPPTDLIDSAYELFKENLAKLREIVPVTTICMHGSPLSRYDNKMIWGKYNYKDLELIGEPYFDIDWNKFGYLTDTGRKWNGGDSSVRDKVKSKYKFKFKSTKDIIANINQLPDKIMFTVHPQRWSNNLVPWLNEYFSQNIKNIIKKYFYIKA